MALEKYCSFINSVVMERMNHQWVLQDYLLLDFILNKYFLSAFLLPLVCSLTFEIITACEDFSSTR